MGRGQGGSKSYGKRTPGGIKTSSKMSKIGEIEAKHGVFGDDNIVGNYADLTVERIAGKPGGSNPGGIFRAADGSVKYIKSYKEPTHAYGELVANKIYNALGIKAPKAVVFSIDKNEPGVAGRALAHDYVEGETLYDHGVTPEVANKILDGTAADLLMANWDAVGLDEDNIIISPEGEPVRVDNGSAFLHRAQAARGRKPTSLLHKLTEWETLANADERKGVANPSYAKVLSAAGYTSLDQMVPRLKEQMKKINELAANTNDFEDLVPDAPGVNKEDRASILAMLRKRRELLNEKIGLGDEAESMEASGEEGQEKQAVASNAVRGLVPSFLFQRNADEHNMTPAAWRDHLDGLSLKMGEMDDSGNFVMNDDEFNKEVGDLVISNMQDQHASGRRSGGVTFLPNTGKVFVLGDTHERYDNVLAIYDEIQSNPETNLDTNPNNRIVLNGDAFAMTKEGQERGQIGKRDTLRGEAMLRLITYLMARHPDQVFMTNGNHEMGVLLALKSRQDPDWESRRVSGNKFKDLPREQLGVSNIKLLVDLIENNGIAVSIGNKKKGETARLITHTAGESGEHATAEEMAQESDPMEWREKYYSTYNGWSDLSPAGLKESTTATKVDKRYFGHVDPSAMEKIMKTADRGTPIGEYPGGGVFVDTQTGGKKSGYVEIDLDKDKDTVRLMDEVYNKHDPEGALFNSLHKIANAPMTKATTSDSRDKRWLDKSEPDTEIDEESYQSDIDYLKRLRDS